ncbi:contact-dependent growth inhibition system immunity protein [Amycolatopsis sp. NPDC059657]|uniref:contact-dependent growth inhibition system immunity protein n=1 Tax=Amycolatopsis sp. NPDC059657 TaxID=3346899 RepID=UPI00366B93CF
MTLESIENDSWGELPTDATRLMETVHLLRRKPIETFTVEDLRILVAQGVGLAVVVPMALAELEQNPLAEGDMYPGDLLAAMARVPSAYWDQHPREAARFAALPTKPE